MNIFLTAIGSAGDVHPMVGLGARLLARGHRVTIAANPYFAPLVERVGLELVPLSTAEEFQTIMHDPLVWHRVHGVLTVAREVIIPSMRPVYEAIRERYVPGELVVAAHSLDFGSRMAQEKLGVPVATVHLAPSVFRSVYQSPVLPPMLLGDWVPRPLKRFQNWLADVLLVDPVLKGPTNAFRSELGLPPVRRLFHRWWHSPDLVIGMFPDWFAAPQPDWPEQTVLTGFPLWDESEVSEMPDDAAEFLAAGERPIVFTPGSANLHARAFFQAAVDACRRLGRRGMLLTRHAEQLPARLAPEVKHFDYVPLSRVLPHAAALVHHGGIGTLAQGLAGGVPHLVMPMAFDQPDNARRLERLGVAASLRPQRFRGPAVARTLAALIDSREVQSACAGLAARTDGARSLARACDVLEAALVGPPSDGAS